MEEWMKQPVSYLKKLVKSRAGRVAELQMEIKILEGIIGRKVADGDLGGSMPSNPAPQPKAPSQATPVEAAKPAEEVPTPAETPQTAPEQTTIEATSEQTKITNKSSNHAFKEID